jgi:hypothetical protein
MATNGGENLSSHIVVIQRCMEGEIKNLENEIKNLEGW